MQSYFWCLLFALISTISATVYFEENFSNDDWQEKWIYSKRPEKQFGNFTRTAGKFFNDEKEDQGIQTSEDARFYAISTKFTPFSNKDKDLIIQFSVKHEQNIDCGGGYIKVFDCTLESKDLHGETPYLIMFGPDICGPGTKKVHAIIHYKGKNLDLKKEVRCKDDVYSHMYTFIIRPNNTYEIFIDDERVESGGLEDDWDFLPPKQIKDESQKKPDDWVDDPLMDDPNDSKPEDWDQPEHIADPDATQPEDWDNEMDGDWAAPMIDNPDYKGQWTPKKIDNPGYKGPWVQPLRDNPDYKTDSELYKHEEICAVGLDLWQVKSGTIFDNIMITDDLETAKKAAVQIKTRIEGEKKMKEQQDEDERKKTDKDEKEKDESKDDEDEDEEEDNTIPDVEEHDEL